MKRRAILKSLAALPAAAVLPAQEPAVPPKPTPSVVEETPKIQASVPDAIAETVPQFFSADAYSALKRLSDLLMPAVTTVSGSTPGAIQAHAPEFLDFLIGQSPADRQALYRTGLDRLNAEARRRYSKAFSELDARQADSVLAPLHAAWTYVGPVDPLARFLQTAKEDVMTATVNSREWIGVVSKRGRRGGNVNTYWLPIDPIRHDPIKA
ncbi:MAG: gluconate 2-dehydrogenase subunit 3 family protein [Acidobacteriota bacterium]|nr:gluconate 2-dehydrogenase subunit 3 family protein [Acidobacteriota bacterium]